MNNSKRRLHIELNRKFLGWCAKNELSITENHEVFFINESMLMKPEYVINNGIYVDILKRGEFKPENMSFYQDFANSFGTIVLIREEFMHDLDHITKAHLIDRYKLDV